MSKIYRIAPSGYHPFRDKLKYMPKDELNDALLLNENRFKTFLRNTGAQLLYVKNSGFLSDHVIPVFEDPTNPSLPVTVPRMVELPKHIIRYSSYGYHGGRRGDYLSIIQTLLTPVVDKEIHVTVPHAEYSSLEKEGAFQVKIWSTPSHTGRYNNPQPETMWGYNIGCTGGAFLPSGEGLPLMCEDFCFGELFENGLYIHFDAIERGSDDELCIFAKMMEIAAEAYKTTDFVNLAEKMAAEKIILSEKSLVDFASRSVRRNSTRKKEEVAALQTNIKSVSKQLFDLERELATIKAGGTKADVEKQVLEEFRKLNNGFGNVKSAYFEGNSIVVMTKPLNAKDNYHGQTYHLGPVKLTIPFEEHGEVLMQDPTGEKIIPHTEGTSGVTCLGSGYTEVMSYMANYEMLSAVSFMIAFLENGIDINDDWGQNLEDFPVLA